MSSRTFFLCLFSQSPPPNPCRQVFLVLTWFISFAYFCISYDAVQLCLTLCDPMDYIQQMIPCPSLFHRVCSNSCWLSQWSHPTISYSFIRFSSFLQTFPNSGSFSIGQLFTTDVQNTGISASASVFPMNINIPMNIIKIFIFIFHIHNFIKWGLESITTNKASGGDGIPVELFQILKDDTEKNTIINTLFPLCFQTLGILCSILTIFFSD